MTAFIFGCIALIALAVAISAARIVAWVLDWRAYTASSQQREQAFFAQVCAEVPRA